MPSRPSAHRIAARLIVAAGLLLFFALGLGAALDKSPTNDEPVHLTRALLLRQSGDLGLQFEHAPLSHRLMGLLLPALSLPVVRELDAWPAGDRLFIARELFWSRGIDVDRLLFLGRLPILWVGLILGALVARWTQDALRRKRRRGPLSDAGLLGLATAVLLFATSPNLIASAALATTDLVAAATYFAAVYLWWRHWARPGRGLLVATGLALGLALAAKLTGVVLLPVLLLLGLFSVPRRAWGRALRAWLALLPVALLTLWAVYAFEFRPIPLATYWASWQAVLTHVEEGHQAFFLGRTSNDGWWSYFPISLLVKTPLPMLLLVAAALVLMVRARAWRIGAYLLLPIAAILAAAAVSRLNIGYRHILPALPFALVGAGLAAAWLARRRVGRAALVAVLVWALAAALWVHPHHLAYFNELVGGPANGYRILGDSNLDWGQDLKGLAEVAVPGLRYSYAGAADPAYYGLVAPSLAGPDGLGDPGFSPANPAPGTYALSAGHVQGLLAEADLFDWFRRRDPDGSVGYSILLYEVAAAQEGGWIASCAPPGPLLPDDEAERMLGVSGVRHVRFDCAQTWVFPAGGPGWYVLPRSEAAGWVKSYLPEDALAQTYEHRATERAPDYTIYRWSGDDPAAALALTTSTEAGADPLPRSFDGTAALEGYGGSGEAWLTLWRVLSSTDRPLSVQAHLVAADGSRLVADRLGFTADQWQPGDWFIQRHDFAAASAGALETGLYDFINGESLGAPVRLPPAMADLSE